MKWWWPLEGVSESDFFFLFEKKYKLNASSLTFVCIVGCLVAQSCLTLCEPMDCSPPGSSVHGILQAKKLEYSAMPSFREYSQPKDWTEVSRIAGGFFPIWATRAKFVCRLIHVKKWQMKGFQLGMRRWELHERWYLTLIDMGPFSSLQMVPTNGLKSIPTSLTGLSCWRGTVWLKRSERVLHRPK